MVGNSTPHSQTETTDVPNTINDFGFSPADVVPYMNDPQSFTYAPFDIETTGRLWDDEVNLLGIRKNGVTTVFTRTDAPSDDITLDEDALEATTEETVDVRRCKDEQALFERSRRYVGELFDGETIFVAYNGETYKGGFDLAFLRMRAEQYDMEHPFKGVRFFDPYEPIAQKGRLHTMRPTIRGNPDCGTLSKNQIREFAEFLGVELPEGDEFPDHLSTKRGLQAVVRAAETPDDVLAFAEERLVDPSDDSETAVGLPMARENTLDDVYEMITGGEDVAYDPWEDSGKVLDAWENGNLHDIALHNIADLYQTQAVMEMAVRQFDPRQLQPSWL